METWRARCPLCCSPPSSLLKHRHLASWWLCTPCYWHKCFRLYPTRCPSLPVISRIAEHITEVQHCILALQDDGLGRSPLAHGNSLPVSDGCPPPTAAAGDDSKKLTSLASLTRLPKVEDEAESGGGDEPGELADADVLEEGALDGLLLWTRSGSALTAAEAL